MLPVFKKAAQAESYTRWQAAIMWNRAAAEAECSGAAWMWLDSAAMND
jgi:hypothetical protein